MTVMLPNINSAPKAGKKKLDSLNPRYNKPNPANIPPHPRIILASRINISLKKGINIHHWYSYILDNITHVHTSTPFEELQLYNWDQHELQEQGQVLTV